MCLLVIVNSAFGLLGNEQLTEYVMQLHHGDWGWHLLECTGLDNFHTGRSQLFQG